MDIVPILNHQATQIWINPYFFLFVFLNPSLNLNVENKSLEHNLLQVYITSDENTLLRVNIVRDLSCNLHLDSGCPKCYHLSVCLHGNIFLQT